LKDGNVPVAASQLEDCSEEHDIRERGEVWSKP